MTAAVVLTLGEPTTGRALAAIERQTLAPAELVRVEGVRPFYRAFNEAVQRVTAPFFVQVDADMVLDRGCFQALRRAMTDGVGIAVGALRDPLAGRIAGVKMFRTECFEGMRLRDVPAPEIDFYLRLADRGWTTRCVTWPALGDHLPDHSLDGVFGTYYMLGARYAHRADGRGYAWRVRRLRESSHELAPVARVALGHGLFGRVSSDTAKPAPAPDQAAFLAELVLNREDRARQLRASLAALAEIDHPRSYLVEAALAHGALAE